MASTGASILSTVQNSWTMWRHYKRRGLPNSQVSITLSEIGVIFLFPEAMLIYLQKSACETSTILNHIMASFITSKSQSRLDETQNFHISITLKSRVFALFSILGAH